MLEESTILIMKQPNLAKKIYISNNILIYPDQNWEVARLNTEVST